MRGLSVRGARRSEVARASCRAASASGPTLPRRRGVACYARACIEHGEQAQRSNGGPLMCLAPQPVRHAGQVSARRARFRAWTTPRAISKTTCKLQAPHH